MATTMCLLFVVLVACTAVELTEARRTNFSNPVYIDLSASFDFSRTSSASQKNRLLLKIVTTYTKTTRNERVVKYYQDLCFSEEGGDWDSDPQSWEELHDKVSRMVFDMLESGTPKGTIMLRMKDDEWRKLPQEDQDKCNRTRIFILRKQKNPVDLDQHEEPEQFSQKEINGDPKKKKSGLLVPGCIMDKNCTQKCFSTPSSHSKCSRLEFECSLRCRKSAINFNPASSSSKLVVQSGKRKKQFVVHTPAPIAMATPKSNARKNRKKNGQRN